MAFAQLVFPDCEAFIGIAVCWIIFYPILLTITYILGIKKAWYLPFLIVIIADTAIILAYFIWWYATSTYFDIGFCLWDSILGLLFVTIYILALRNQNRKKQNGAPDFT